MGNANPVPQTPGEGETNSASTSGPVGRRRGGRQRRGRRECPSCPSLVPLRLSRSVESPLPPKDPAPGVTPHPLPGLHLPPTQGPASSRQVVHLLRSPGGTCVTSPPAFPGTLTRAPRQIHTKLAAWECRHCHLPGRGSAGRFPVAQRWKGAVDLSKSGVRAWRPVGVRGAAGVTGPCPNGPVSPLGRRTGLRIKVRGTPGGLSG